MITSVNQIQYSKLAPMFVDKDIIVAIDSSKTNTAIVIKEVDTGKRTIVEFDGSADRDVIDLAKEHRDKLRELLKGSNVILGGIEDIITKKNEGIRNTHEVRFKLTYIFSSIIVFFQDTLEIKLELVNNQAWKNLTIGPELNKRSVYKGSVEYIYSKYPEYRGYSNDATDAMCIMEYLEKVHKIKAYSKPDSIEHREYQVATTTISSTTDLSATGYNEFGYNYDMEIEDNISFIANRAPKGSYSYSKVDLTKLKIEDVLSLIDSGSNYMKMEPYLNLVVYHKEGRG